MKKITITNEGEVKQTDIFPDATVHNNLVMGDYTLSYPSIIKRGESVFQLEKHSLHNRLLVYRCENGHSIRVYY